MMNIKDTNRDIEYFKKGLSIENLLLSIRQLKERVRKLETQRVYDVPKPEHI